MFYRCQTVLAINNVTYNIVTNHSFCLLELFPNPILLDLVMKLTCISLSIALSIEGFTLRLCVLPVLLYLGNLRPLVLLDHCVVTSLARCEFNHVLVVVDRLRIAQARSSSTSQCKCRLSVSSVTGELLETLGVATVHARPSSAVDRQRS